MSFPDINWELLAKKISQNSCISAPASAIEQLRHKTWILSYSGGPDSSLALFYLLALHKEFNIPRTLVIYFLDHQINYPPDVQIEREKIFNTHLETARNTKDLNLIFSSHRRDIKSIAKKTGLTWERAGSLLRKKQLGRLSSTHRNSIIITGHQLDDWYETVIMRINRGTTLPHILPWLSIESERNLTYFRPLLALSKTEVTGLCAEANIPCWDDPENQNISSTRNNIRHNYPPINYSGLKSTFYNLQKKRAAILNSRNLVLKKIPENSLITIAPYREYRLLSDTLSHLSLDEQKELFTFLSYNIGLWPLRKSLYKQLFNRKLQYKNYSVEKENWGNQTFIVFRRGNHTLFPSPPAETIKSFINGKEITKSHLIRLNYGSKSVKKIFSEAGLSDRQRRSLWLPVSNSGCGYVSGVPLSVFGLKDMTEKKIDQVQ